MMHCVWSLKGCMDSVVPGRNQNIQGTMGTGIHFDSCWIADCDLYCKPANSYLACLDGLVENLTGFVGVVCGRNSIPGMWMRDHLDA